jgi:hypothetical protein
MKAHLRLGILFLGLALPAQSQILQQTNLLPSSLASSSTPYQIVQRAQDSALWQRLSFSTNQSGRVTIRTNQIMELETGKHYRSSSGGPWVKSREEIGLVSGGAVAVRTPTKVAFAANINSPVSLQVLTPDNKLLKMRVLGMAYYDFHARSNVLVSALGDSVGQLTGASTNQILYTNALPGLGDVRYTVKKSGLEQDIILRHRPEFLPEDVGFNPETTRVLVLTEFIGLTNQVRTVRQIRRGWKQDTVDKVVDFGAMKIGHGSAFSLGPNANRNRGVPVQKHWAVLEGRTFLIEEVAFPRIVSSLRDLQASAGSGGTSKTLLARHDTLHAPRSTLHALLSTPPPQTAAAPAPPPFDALPIAEAPPALPLHASRTSPLHPNRHRAPSSNRLGPRFRSRVQHRHHHPGLGRKLRRLGHR